MTPEQNEDNPMTKDTVNTKYGCCDECGCNITMGHFAHCSKYTPAARRVLNDEQREQMRKEFEKFHGKDTKDSGMPDTDQLALDILNECEAIGNRFYPRIPDAQIKAKMQIMIIDKLNQRIAEAVAKERERILNSVNNLNQYSLVLHDDRYLLKYEVLAAICNEEIKS